MIIEKKLGYEIEVLHYHVPDCSNKGESMVVYRVSSGKIMMTKSSIYLTKFGVKEE